MPRISCITTCKGRLDHLRLSLPRLMAQTDCEVVVVDYDCPEGAGAWVAAEHPGARVVSVRNQPWFNAAKARNLGAAAATSQWLLFADADVLVAPDLAAKVGPVLSPEAYFTADPRPPELWGTLFVHRSAFDAVGGYDEVFEGWGSEDIDFTDRLESAGVVMRPFPGDLVKRILHADTRRAAFHQIGHPHVNVLINGAYAQVKKDLARMGVPLSQAGRSKLYDDIRSNVAAAGMKGSTTRLEVTFRQDAAHFYDLTTRLTYDLDWTKLSGRSRT